MYKQKIRVYENKDGAVSQKGEFEWIEETY